MLNVIQYLQILRFSSMWNISYLEFIKCGYNDCGSLVLFARYFLCLHFQTHGRTAFCKWLGEAIWPVLVNEPWAKACVTLHWALLKWDIQGLFCLLPWSQAMSQTMGAPTAWVRKWWMMRGTQLTQEEHVEGDPLFSAPKSLKFFVTAIWLSFSWLIHQLLFLLDTLNFLQLTLVHSKFIFLPLLICYWYHLLCHLPI